MKRIPGPVVLLFACVASLFAGDADGKRWWSYVEALANDGMRGRQTGSSEHRKAAEYVASQFQQAGLSPAGVNGYLQPVKFDVRRIVEPQSSLELVRNGQADRLVLGEDATISLRNNPADSVEAPACVCRIRPVGSRNEVRRLRRPRPERQDGRHDRRRTVEHSRQSARALWLRLRAGEGSRAGRRDWSRDDSEPLQRGRPVGALVARAAAGVDEPHGSGARRHEEHEVTVTVNAAHADKWLAGSGHTIAELLKLADAGQPLPRFPLNASLRAKVKVERRQVESQNVVAALPGTDPVLKNEYVVLSAHLDHVGVGEPIKGDAIYNGAMDDASGVASLLEIARSLRDAGQCSGGRCCSSW